MQTQVEPVPPTQLAAKPTTPSGSGQLATLDDEPLRPVPIRASPASAEPQLTATKPVPLAPPSPAPKSAKPIEPIETVAASPTAPPSVDSPGSSRFPKAAVTGPPSRSHKGQLRKGELARAGGAPRTQAELTLQGEGKGGAPTAAMLGLFWRYPRERMGAWDETTAPKPLPNL